MSQVVLIPKLVEKIARQTPPSSSLVYQNIRQKSKLREREENDFEFEFKMIIFQIRIVLLKERRFSIKVLQNLMLPWKLVEKKLMN